MNESNYFEGVASYRLLAKKEVGQNFLIDSSFAKRIVDALEAKEGERVLEIGCGAGSLSFFLSQGSAKTDTIDIDEAMITKVRTDFADSEYLNPFIGNAMKFDYEPYDKIIGNLPYYITSGIIERVLLKASKASRCVFMVQKEAAERLLSKPGTKDYSPLSIYISVVSKARKLFNVPRNAFAPAPHVDSTVIELEFNEKHGEKAAKMYRFALAMFLQRRKTILNNLKNYLHSSEKAAEILEKMGIPATYRAEQILPEQYWQFIESGLLDR